MISCMNDSLVFHLNKANLNKIRDIMEVMPRNKHGKFLIDQSTVGLHLTGARRINIEQCYIYAKILKIHPWRVLDDYVCRYPVVGNFDIKTGKIESRGKFQNDYLVCSNDLEYEKNTLVIMSKSSKIAYLYNENIYLRENNLNTEEPQRCLLDTDKGEFMVFVNDIDFKKQTVEYILSNESGITDTKKMKYNCIRPINEIIYLNTVSKVTALIEHAFDKPKEYY